MSIPHPPPAPSLYFSRTSAEYISESEKLLVTQPGRHATSSLSPLTTQKCRRCPRHSQNNCYFLISRRVNPETKTSKFRATATKPRCENPRSCAHQSHQAHSFCLTEIAQKKVPNPSWFCSSTDFISLYSFAKVLGFDCQHMTL